MLAKRFPPKGGTYVARDIRTFVEIAGFSQIAMRAGGFAKQIVDQGEAVDIDAFPSIKMTAFTVFFKFYIDEHRAPATSDAFDVIIAAPTPYVDAVVTERHQVEVIRRRSVTTPLCHVSAYTLRDFRDGPPEHRLPVA